MPWMSREDTRSLADLMEKVFLEKRKRKQNLKTTERRCLWKVFFNNFQNSSGSPRPTLFSPGWTEQFQVSTVNFLTGSFTQRHKQCCWKTNFFLWHFKEHCLSFGLTYFISHLLSLSLSLSLSHWKFSSPFNSAESKNRWPFWASST